MDQNEISGALRELAGEGTPAPVDQLLRRGQQARRRRSVGVSAAALGVVAALGVGAVGVGAWSSPDDRTAVVQAADLRLAAAAEATAQSTFGLRVTIQSQARSWVREGGYDPVKRAGFLRWTDNFGNPLEQRVIGDDTYLMATVDGKRNQWRKMTGGSGFPMVNLGEDGAPSLSVDPSEVLSALRDNGTVRDLGRSGGVQRYSFTFSGKTTNNRTVSGTVEVGVDSGKVSKVSYQIAGAIAPTSLVLEFFDHGTPVTVERPA